VSENPSDLRNFMSADSEVTVEWGLPARPVVADAGYGDATEFRLGLTERGLTYVLAVSPAATAHPAEAVPTSQPI